MTYIPMSNAECGATIDDTDYELLWKYNFHKNKGGYPTTHIIDENGKRVTKQISQILTGLNGIDHIDRNKMNNRRSNFRIATPRQQSINKTAYINNTTGYKGVFKVGKTGRFITRLVNDYKKHHIGTFPTPEEAALAYNKKAIELHGEFAVLNEVKECQP